VWIVDGNPGKYITYLQQSLGGPAQHHLDPRRLGRREANHRVEDLAAEVEAAGRALRR
jgi:hypothetical protein